MLRSRLNDEKGQAMVEMAIVTVLLMTLVFGITEFGRLYYYNLTISSAARAGARYAAVTHLTTSQTLDDYKNNTIKPFIAEKVFPGDTVKQNALKNPDIAGGSIAIVFSPTANKRNTGERIDITIYYPVPIVAPFISAFTGPTETVTAHVSMMLE